MARNLIKRIQSVFAGQTVRAIVCLLSVALMTGVASAQNPGSRTMARNGWRWQSPQAQGIYRANGLQQRVVTPGYGYRNRYFGYGFNYGLGYGFNPWVYGSGVPIYGSYVPNQAEVVMAQGLANRANAQAAESIEAARRQAIENQVHLTELRSRQRAARAEREEAKRAAQAERRAFNAVRLPQSPTELYDRLIPEEINAALGQVAWPLPLQLPQFAVHRDDVADTLREINAFGPSEARAIKLKAIVDDMKKGTDVIISDFGFDTYRETRKFLCSLSVEGFYALEEAVGVPLPPAAPAAN